mmetsp:Transcript_35005/g.74674  ORF Transcript_35005/g.74674 Transcript_35005/m.74674 type:complete len:562 (+) Transcript_35005:292-1977(+)
MLKVHGERMTSLDPPELHDVIRVVPLAELEVLDAGDLDPAAEVEDEGAELDVPPGRTVLEDHEPVVVSGRVCRVVVVGGIADVVVGSQPVLEVFQPLLDGLESVEHGVGAAAAIARGDAVPLLPAPLFCHSPVLRELGDADVHDARAVAQEVGRVGDGSVLHLPSPVDGVGDLAHRRGGGAQVVVLEGLVVVGDGPAARAVVPAAGDVGARSPGHSPRGLLRKGAAQLRLAVLLLRRISSSPVAAEGAAAAATGQGGRGAADHAFQAAAPAALLPARGGGVPSRGGHSGGGLDGMTARAVLARGPPPLLQVPGIQHALVRHEYLKLRPDEVALQPPHLHAPAAALASSSVGGRRHGRDGQAAFLAGVVLRFGIVPVGARVVPVHVSLVRQAHVVVGHAALAGRGGRGRPREVKAAHAAPRPVHIVGHVLSLATAALVLGDQQNSVLPWRGPPRVKRIVVLGVPHKQPVFVAGKELALHPLGHALGTFPLAGHFDALDLALDGPHRLGAGRGEEGVEVGHAGHWRLLVEEVYARRGGEELVPEVEEALLEGEGVKFGVGSAA